MMESPTPASVQTLLTMSRSRKDMYAGTAPPDEVAKRRAKNKRARKQRISNCRRSR